MLEALSNNLQDNVGEWLRGGPEDDVVLSTRVRLARNIAGYPFLSRASPQQIARIEELLHEKILSCRFRERMNYYRLNELDPLLRQLLVERHLMGRDHAEASWVRGLAFCADEHLSLMVNEEDHLRMQAVCGGLQPRRAFEEVCEVDDALAEVIPFAFSARYGYLTACPTNVGTGMRASVMVHLPALIMTREMDKVIEMSRRLKLALRGLYGEGTRGSADLYQISNRVSLGVKEEKILAEVSRAAGGVMSLERNARENLLREDRSALQGRIERALELLREASMISSEETLHLLSQVRMGVHMSLVKGVGLKELNELLLLTLPAHLQTIEGKRVERLKRNELRAARLKEKLSVD